MTQFLPPSLLALFAARDPIPFLPPVTKLTHEKASHGYSGVGAYLHLFEDPADTPPPTKYETRDERHERKRREKQEQVVYKLEQEIALWAPNNNEKATMDPFRTLFVARINFDSSESKLKREFESYGPVKKIVLMTNKKTGKPRGYAFVEFEHERDMHSAYRHADGKKIDGKRVLVDIERGRTVKGWLPRRLGGGLGGTRRGGPEVNLKISGREDPDRDRFRDDPPREDRPHRRDREDRERNDSSKRDRSRGRDRDKDKDRSRGDRVERNSDRDRGDRDRDRADRKRRRSRSKDKKDRGNEEGGDEKRKRSRSREKKKHRSKSRDRKRKRDKDRDGERGDRDRDRDRSERKGKDRIKSEEDLEVGEIRVKEEPVDDYPSYDDSYYNGDGYMKPEPDDDADGPPVLRSDGAGNEDYGEY